MDAHISCSAGLLHVPQGAVMANGGNGSSRPRRAHKPSSMLWSAGDDHPLNRKRAASEAAAHLTRPKIEQLFGLSLAEAAERVGVRH